MALAAKWPGGRRSAISWSIYDWANSPFSTVVITFVFSAYFVRAVAETPELGGVQWAFAMGISGVTVAVVGPVIGAIADQGGRRKPWIAGSTLICVILTASLWFVRPDLSFVLAALLLAAFANVAFEFGQIFYNALLPELVPRALVGRVSGWAWGLGYAGGLVCLVLALLLVLPDPPLFGLDKEAAEHVRATGPLVAVWFAVFSVPLLLYTVDRPASGLGAAATIGKGLRSLATTLLQVRRHAVILRFLLARMIYTDGMNTLLALGGIYAAVTFGMSVPEVLLFGILLNLTAGMGAAAFAWLDNRIGPKATILSALIALFVFGTGVLLVQSKLWFYVLAAALGVFVGPVQASSRSFMARIAPQDIRAEMFGLYAVSGKISAFVGPFLVGLVTVATGSQRWGMATILVFFVVGFLLLTLVPAPQRLNRAT